MSDTISRAKAIEALKNDMASLDHIIKGMSANDVRLDAYVSQRNQVNYDIYTINNLPPAPGTDLAEVGTDCISRQAAIDICRAPHMRNADCSDFEMAIMMLPPAQPERIKGRWEVASTGYSGFMRCSECKAGCCGDYRSMNFCPNCGADMREVTT